MTPDQAQIIAGFMISFAYVPQIYKMKKNMSSEDVSLSFLLLVWVSLIMMGWYSIAKFSNQAGGASLDNDFFPLLLTNVVNFVMVTITIFYAVKLRR